MTAQLTTEPGYKLVYIVSHEAYYRRVVRDREIIVQKAADDGGCAWEFGIREHHNVGIRAKVVDDAFRAFAEIAPLFTALAQQRPRDFTGVRDLLDTLGFVDATERKDPTEEG